MDISFRMLIHDRAESEQERADFSWADFIIYLSSRSNLGTDIITAEFNLKGRVQNPGSAEHSLVGWNAGSVGRKLSKSTGNTLLELYLGPVRRGEPFCIQVLSYD